MSALSDEIYLPAEIHAEVHRLSHELGLDQKEVVALAWRAYMKEHPREMEESIKHLAKLIREGRTDEILAELTIDAAEQARVKNRNAKRRRGHGSTP